MTGRCEHCLKRLTADDEVVEYRAISDAPSRGGRQKVYVTKFHPECDAARLREFQESQERARVREEEDRAAMLAAIGSAREHCKTDANPEPRATVPRLGA